MLWYTAHTETGRPGGPPCQQRRRHALRRQTGRRDVRPVLTHRYELERFDEAVDLLQTSKDCGKVLITMEGW